MRVLVTGASGFVGSYLTEQLVERGHEVAIVHRESSDLWRIEAVLPRLHRICGDLKQFRSVRPAITAFAPEVIYHLAWEGVANRHRNDEAQLWNNLDPALDLVQLAREIGCRAWVGLGSQAEYGPRPARVTEDDPTNPTTMYGAVKLCTFLLSKQLLDGTATRFAWLRLFSSYGPKDGPGWMIPDLIRALARRERPRLTAGQQIWDYVFVADAADAIAKVGLCESAMGAYNLGAGQATPLRSIIEAVRDQVDPSLPLGFGEVAYRSDQIMHLEADVSRLKRDVGWVPRTSLENGLRKTVAWYLEHP